MFGTWMLLVVAITTEVTATALLPKAQGFTNPGWTAVVLFGYIVSTWLLTIIVKTMPVSITYAIWAGVGTAVVAVIGWAFLGEQMNLVKAASMALIVIGVIGLDIVGTH